MKRDDTDVPKTPGIWKCPDEHFVKIYPALAEGMCDALWEDGKSRKTWKISIGFEGDTCSVCLTDKNKGCYSYTTAGTLSDALRLVNEAILAKTLAWRKNTR